MELRILPKNLADMIAAGEVVQRPASVVKELMENAVDAGATDVKVVISDAGRTLIQVIDNGCGMTPDDAVLCFERHATSKLATAEDLHRILSFGFRGEALASIAAVAEVTLRTRTAGQEAGVEVSMAASENKGTRAVSCPTGTNIAVRNLFYNIPARRKFLKSDQAELRHIVEEFQRVALTRPDVAFSLTHNGREIHVVKAAKSHKFRIQDLLGPAVIGELVDLEADTSIAVLRGFVGKPESARKLQGKQFFFVNGRYFRSAYLHKAVMKGYENLIPEGSSPSYFIYIDVDPGTVDINIHPTKAEIKFEEEQLLFQTVFAAVREAMGRNGTAGALEFDHPQEIPVMGRRFEEYRPADIPGVGVDWNYNPFAQDGEEKSVPESRPTASYVQKSENYGALFEERTLPAAQILVVQGRYIFTQSASGIMVVHVRRARERIFHDRFLKALSARVPVSQQSLFPEPVAVGADDRLLFDEYADTLHRIGFDIAPFGTDTVVVHGVPEGYSAEPGQAQSLVADLLLILRDNPSALPGVVEASLAQKFAVLGASAGKKLHSPIEAQRLMDALLQCENPEFTAAGKRIISIVPADEIEKRF